MIETPPQLMAKLGRRRWLAVTLGASTSAFSALALWFMFALKEFSSAVRDGFEAPPGPVQYIVFGIACLGLLLLFALGLSMLFVGVRRPRDV